VTSQCKYLPFNYSVARQRETTGLVVADERITTEFEGKLREFHFRSSSMPSSWILSSLMTHLEGIASC